MPPAAIKQYLILLDTSLAKGNILSTDIIAAIREAANPDRIHG